jgi:hypothetical protein
LSQSNTHSHTTDKHICTEKRILRYRDRHEDEREGGRERERVRKTQREIPNTNVETLQTEQHMFWSADVERGQPDAYDNTLINKTTELNQDLSGVLPVPP